MGGVILSFSNSMLNIALSNVQNRKKIVEEKHNSEMELLMANNKKFRELSEKMQQLGSKLCVSTFSGDSLASAKLQAQIETLQELKDKILAEHNIKKEIEYCCKKCNDTGYVNGKLCECVLLEAKRMRYEELAQEMPIANCTFQNFSLDYYSNTADENGFTPKKVAKKTLEICKDFCKTFPNSNNLYFCGSCGLGKTHLTLAIANEIIALGYDVIYGSSQNIISKINKEQFKFNSESDYLESVLNCDLLILDDLGTEFSTNISASIVYNIINTRILKGLSTIISTNLNIKEIEDEYSARIVSRINGHYTMRKFIGSDIRQIKK